MKEQRVRGEEERGKEERKEERGGKKRGTERREGRKEERGGGKKERPKEHKQIYTGMKLRGRIYQILQQFYRYLKSMNFRG